MAYQAQSLGQFEWSSLGKEVHGISSIEFGPV